MVWGTTPVMLKPNACAPVAAPRAVLPIDGTISCRVAPSRRRWSNRCTAPRILKQPDGARNSHLAYTSRRGTRLPRRINGVGTRGTMAGLSMAICMRDLPVANGLTSTSTAPDFVAEAHGLLSDV